MNHPTTEQVVEELTFREALLPPPLRELRQKLSQKAKQQKRFRFYSLYAHICRGDTLQAAWKAVRRNHGAPGVDGVSIEQIAASPESENAFLAELQQSLKQLHLSRPSSAAGVYPQSQTANCGRWAYPRCEDRVVQAAVLLILEPIFEADFEDCSYGFRPGAVGAPTPCGPFTNTCKGATARFTMRTWRDTSTAFRTTSSWPACGCEWWMEQCSD